MYPQAQAPWRMPAAASPHPIGQMLERERHAGRPFAAHADPEQRAAREQHRVGRREPAEDVKSENQTMERMSGSFRPQRSAAVPAAAPPTRRNIRVTVPSAPASALSIGEAALNIGENKGEDGEVEPVEHPAEERGVERALLIRRQRPELPNELHREREAASVIRLDAPRSSMVSVPASSRTSSTFRKPSGTLV